MESRPGDAAGFSEKIINAGLACNGHSCERIVAGDHHGTNAHGAKMIETFARAAFDHVCECDDAEDAAIFREEKRRAARVGNFFHTMKDFERNAVAAFVDVACDSFAGAFANFAAVNVNAGHAGCAGRALRSVSAWALPRPSAMASAKLAKRTVNQSQNVVCRLKAKPRDHCGRRSLKKMVSGS